MTENYHSLAMRLAMPTKELKGPISLAAMIHFNFIPFNYSASAVRLYLNRAQVSFFARKSVLMRWRKEIATTVANERNLLYLSRYF